MPLLEVTGLSKRFESDGLSVRAVTDVSLEIERGRTLGIVGESGCGKSTLARCLLRLIEPDAGCVRFDGTELTALPARQMRPLRRRLQIVFQSPRQSLEAGMKVGAIVEEGLRIHSLGGRRERRRKVEVVLDMVGLGPEMAGRFPSGLSGGQLQRVAIARALVLEPDLLVLDEPVSALDVSVRANVLNLLRELRTERKLTCLVISHDMAVVRFLSDRIGVMYLGRIVESAPADVLFERPLHPYTRLLLRSIPQPDPSRRGEHGTGRGEPPSAVEQPEGCAFHPRCEELVERCREFRPVLQEVEPDHLVACARSGRGERGGSALTAGSG